jgi:uncharacterized membrane protein
MARTSFWFVPALMASGAVLLATAMLWLDGWASDEWISALPWIHSRSNAGARDLLSTVASSMITVAGVTFSIVVVALQLASSQLGPRLLRNFMGDVGNQVVLGTFIATFVYCLLVMRTIGGEVESGPLPRLSVTTAVVLAMASLGVLIYFIHHAAASMQVPNVIAAVSRQLHEAIERLYPEQEHGNSAHPAGAVSAVPRVDASRGADTRFVRSEESGYVQRIDFSRLVAIAAEADVGIRLLVRPGTFIVRGAPLAEVVEGVHVDSSVSDRITAACILGAQRTPEQDVEFTVGQLVEIALRALSPGVNDPFTAIACIDHLSSAFGLLLQRPTPSAARRDSHGHVRVFASPPAAEELLVRAFDPMRDASRNSALVIGALLDALLRMAPSAHTERQRHALMEQARLARDASRLLPSAPDRAAAEDRVARLTALMSQDGAAPPAARPVRA